MSEPVLNGMTPTSINILYTFPVIYTNCKVPRSGRRVSSSVGLVVTKMERLESDVIDSSEKHEETKPDKIKHRKLDESMIHDLQMRARRWNLWSQKKSIQTVERQKCSTLAFIHSYSRCRPYHFINRIALLFRFSLWLVLLKWPVKT